MPVHFPLDIYALCEPAFGIQVLPLLFDAATVPHKASQIRTNPQRRLAILTAHFACASFKTGRVYLQPKEFWLNLSCSLLQDGGRNAARVPLHLLET